MCVFVLFAFHLMLGHRLLVCVPCQISHTRWSIPLLTCLKGSLSCSSLDFHHHYIIVMFIIITFHISYNPNNLIQVLRICHGMGCHNWRWGHWRNWKNTTHYRHYHTRFFVCVYCLCIHIIVCICICLTLYLYLCDHWRNWKSTTHYHSTQGFLYLGNCI